MEKFNVFKEKLMIENLSLEQVMTVAKAVEKFSWSLYRVMKETNNGNLVFSPYGVHVVLAMLSEGARGATLEIMKREMFLPDSEILRKGYEDVIPAMKTGFLVKFWIDKDSFFKERGIMVDDNYILETAYGGFFMRGSKLLGSFETDLKKSYHAEMIEVDYQDEANTSRIINHWVQKSTKDFVEDFITADSLDEEFGIMDFASNPGIIVLTNALYFNCDWNFKLSQPVVFWVTEGESKQVPMLTLCSEMKYACLEELGAAMIELPDNKSRFVMQVVVPDDRMGVFELENGLVDTDIQDLFRRKHQTVVMDLALPKLNLTNNLNLSDSLKKVGLADLFSADTSDFSGLNGSRFLSLTEVKQKVVLEMGECKQQENHHFWSGWFSGPDTEMIKEPIGFGSMFYVDHPFIFMIRDTITNMILLQGRVVDPSL